jgi:hypothetical protein
LACQYVKTGLAGWGAWIRTRTWRFDFPPLKVRIYFPFYRPNLALEIPAATSCFTAYQQLGLETEIPAKSTYQLISTGGLFNGSDC